MNRLAIIVAGFMFSAGAMMAGEKGVMHCFAFTVVDGATPQQWEAFGKATDALPQKVKGIEHVWRGKLMRPLTQYSLKFKDDEARKKFTDAGEGTVDARLLRRQHGVCMEFTDEAAFKAYGSDPAHKEWVAVYEKVRVPGTTTYQIVGE
jgi:hypothetical protein